MLSGAGTRGNIGFRRENCSAANKNTGIWRCVQRESNTTGLTALRSSCATGRICAKIAGKGSSGKCL